MGDVQHRIAMTMTALCLSYARSVDATLAASSRRLSDRTSWADMDWGGCVWPRWAGGHLDI